MKDQALAPMLTEQFEGHDVRVVEVTLADGETWPGIPWRDVADAIGYDRQSTQDMVRRDDVLEGFSSSSMILLEGGKRRTMKIGALPGINLYLTKLESSRVKDPEKRETIKRFQHDVAIMITKLQTGEQKVVDKKEGPPKLTPELLEVMKLAEAGNIWARDYLKLVGVNLRGKSVAEEVEDEISLEVKLWNSTPQRRFEMREMMKSAARIEEHLHYRELAERLLTAPRPVGQMQENGDCKIWIEGCDVRAARMRLKTYQHVLASFLGISRKQLSDWENGEDIKTTDRQMLAVCSRVDKEGRMWLEFPAVLTEMGKRIS